MRVSDLRRLSEVKSDKPKPVMILQCGGDTTRETVGLPEIPLPPFAKRGKGIFMVRGWPNGHGKLVVKEQRQGHLALPFFVQISNGNK